MTSSWTALPLLAVAMVCRVLGAPRSTVYARRQSKVSARPGPVTSISDSDLLGLIHQVLVDSPFAGEGYRKVRARLRREHQVQVSGKRVLRLLRREGLLAPQRARGRRKPRPHDGTIIPAAPNQRCGCSPAWTTTPPRPGRTWPRWATGSPPSSRSTTRSSTAGASSAQTSSAAWSSATGTAIPLGPLHRLAGVARDHRQPGVPG
jgi:hypothetical protein